MQDFSTQVVILGAGRGARGVTAPAMHDTGGGNRVLDWLLEAFATLPEARVSFVGGYDVESVRQAYPQMDFAINPRWRGSGPSESLGYAQLDTGLPLWVSYADVVYRPGVVQQVARAAQDSGADMVVAIDRQFRHRYERRASLDLHRAEKVICAPAALGASWSPLKAIGRDLELDAAHAEFCGVVRLSPLALREVLRLVSAHELEVQATLPQLLSRLLGAGFSAAAVDVDGEWAELNAPQDLARFVLGTKAESLERLSPLLTTGVVGDLLKVPADDWHDRPEQVRAGIRAAFPNTTIIIRSSSHKEDGWDQSAAGAFESVAGVHSGTDAEIDTAMDTVFHSYGESPAEALQAIQKGNDLRMPHVLVQELVQNVRMSGVVMTRSPQTQAPYYVISFDSESSRTDAVTSGVGEIRTVYLQRDARIDDIENNSSHAKELQAVLRSTRELEVLVGHDSLDIEFAVDEQGQVHVLQVRPIVARHVEMAPDDTAVASALANAQSRFVHQSLHAQPFVLGKRVVWSVMSDWNPAEIVGPKPRRLAHSLYRALITDEVWAAQRARNGYRDVRPCPLLVNVLGHPYVDVRASFNSFIPATLSAELAGRLVDHYTERLCKEPALHDKIEFDIVYTCLAFDHDERVHELRSAGFSVAELEALRDGLRVVTERSMGSCAEDLAQLEHAQERMSVIMKSALEPLEMCRALVEDIRRFGTPLFANLARCGFVATTLLRSLVKVGALEKEAADTILRSVRTVSSDLQEDAWRVKTGALEFDTLVERYGHLRPGTYDICSTSYAEAAEDYLRPMVNSAERGHGQIAITEFVAEHGERVRAQLKGTGLSVSVEALFTFIRNGIEGREFGKFVFTKGLSAALNALHEFARTCNISGAEIAHVSLNDLLNFSGMARDRVAEDFPRLVEAGRTEFAMMQAMHLPGFIAEARDLMFFEQERATANFVTRTKLQASLVELHSDMDIAADMSLKGKVVLVTNADPGFDWLFGRQIAGLVTMYGGANSHMAVRAAEFGLPAAIGVGAASYNELRPEPGRGRVVELDCAAGKIRVVV